MGGIISTSLVFLSAAQAGLKNITCDEDSLILIENGNGGVIDFDIVVSRKKEAIYTCKFIFTT
jgi:hypothetical protein